MGTLTSKGWLVVAVGAGSLAGIASAAEAPPLMLAEHYRADEAVDLAAFWISEKYDGIRAYWNGSRLLTRSGHEINAPAWFTAGLPALALDGELWIGRGQFEAVSAAVRDRVPDDTAWRRVRFMVFDLPGHGGSFGARRTALEAVVAAARVDWLVAVQHSRVADERELRKRLADVVSAGGEGLMLHRDASLYHHARSGDLLKLKELLDAEARVVAYLPGKGKYAGMMGALEVEQEDGTRFRIGTGFTDAERRAPPALGSWVTYTYQGLTSRGVPRFARFVRVRKESQ